jgi:hypothetical protein
MAVVPGELDSIFPDALGGNGFRRRLKKDQLARRTAGRVPGTTPSFPSLLFAHGTRAGIAQVDEAVVRNVTIVPFNVHTGTGCEVYLDGLGIGRGGGQTKRGLHTFKYRIANPSGAGAHLLRIEGRLTLLCSVTRIRVAARGGFR